MIRRSNTASGAYLIRRAVTLARSVVANYGTKTEVLDGFFVRGRRAGPLQVAEVIDPPAWVVVVGTLLGEPSAPVSDSLVLEFPSGRDGLVGAGRAVPSDPTTQFTLVRPQGYTRLGPAPLLPHTYATVTGETMQELPGVGVVRGYNQLYVSQPTVVNPAAFADRNARVQYQVMLLAPQLFRSKLVDTPGGWVRTSTPESVSPWATRSLLISDSYLRSRGALPFAMRVSPPPYDPTSTSATDFAQAQAPWQDFVVERYTVDEGGVDTETYRVTLWAQVTFDMTNDSDKFGARGLWVATVRVQGDVATLLNEFVIDTTAEPSHYRRPSVEPGTNTHRFNAHLRVGGATLNSGTTVIVDPFQVITSVSEGDPTGALARYMSLDLYWISRTGAQIRRVTILDGFRVNSGPHDMRAPIGVATDGEVAVVVAFTTAFSNQPSNLDVIVATETDASVVLSADVPFRQCLSGTPDSRLSTGKDDNVHWGTVGAGGNQVCYIGNNKYLFYVSSQISATVIAGGNWAVAVYDRTENTATLLSVIDPALVSVGEPVTVGRPVCLSPETVGVGGEVTKATVLATRGGFAQQVSNPGVEAGDTWISYDSGESWEQLSSYGSPAGAVYCGNVLAAATGG